MLMMTELLGSQEENKMKKILLFGLLILIPTIASAQAVGTVTNPQTVKLTDHLQWVNPDSVSLTDANSLTATTYLNPGPALTGGVVRTFTCVNSSAPFTCKLTQTVADLIGAVRGNFNVVLTVKDSTSAEIASDVYYFRTSAPGKPTSLVFVP